MSKWQEYSDKFLELSQREKIIISGCGVFLTAYLVFILLIESQVAVLNKSQSALLKHNASLANVRAQIEEVKQALKNDPNDQVKKILND
ncbi:type II secretion system protein GspM [Psychrosphaera algicola]|uniref:Type II secretion system protein GspM n=1 Tax=Psychrosphaera algicola TaxID=3023714 RepID=A0ABT5FF79_9GAMM|nr:type II secretion system protein GspM [Psychrosphaera sp. G1-22]MDC2889592.1 type II secretion system protein GspM [Psychrosphaera sp. G1-22]